MNFPATIAAQLAGRTVRCDVLAEFGFANGFKRLCNSFGPLQTNDGKVWEGIGGIGSVSGLKQAINGSAPPLEFTVSGVDQQFAASARGNRTNYYMRPVVAYLQFFGEDWQCLDNPFAFSFAQMRKLVVNRKSTETGMVYTVTVQCEGPFITRRRARFGFYTDRDQQGRSPGDRFCERVPGIEQKIVVFPTFD